MPRGDGSGPMGFGPMTGRAMGHCAGYPTPGFMNPGFGRSMGFGRGMARGFRGGMGRGGGRGWRNWYYATGLPGWARFGYRPMPYQGVPFGANPFYSQPVPAEQEVEMLRDQADFLRGELEGINKRLEELEAESEDE